LRACHNQTLVKKKMNRDKEGDMSSSKKKQNEKEDL